MCGIAGIINHHADPQVEPVIRAMTAALVHRGPDGDGFLINDDIALGHRRLAVIDLTGGKQPMLNEDGTIAVVLNGEIYNYQVLRRELEARGHRFSTNTDTEVVVHLYEELGSECVAMLEGMFAFAVYNRLTRRVLLARDRMGKKPLYYYMAGDTLVFGSELSALRANPSMPTTLDDNAISDYLSMHYIPSPNTIYRNVRKLPPAHQLEFRMNDGTISIRGYWHLDFSLKSEISFPDAKAELRELVTKAVEKRLMADVPCGSFLSGGLDSSIITAVMAKLRGDAPTDAFTIGFDEESYDERQFANLAGDAINHNVNGRLRTFQEVVNPCDFSLVEKLTMHFGEPFADASMLPTYLLSRFARSRITVALSGDGADEVFAGYERYLAMKYAARFDLLPSLVRKPLFALGGTLIPDLGERTFCGRFRRLLKVVGNVPGKRYHQLLDRCPEPYRKSLIGDRLRSIETRKASEFFDSQQWELTASNPLEQLSELDLHTYLPNDILPKMDIASMAASLEVRSPFLDREIVEFAARLPWNYKLSGSSRKHILKEAFADLLPPEIVNRRKSGFGVPVAIWLRGEWKVQAEELLFDGKLIQDGFINGKALHSLWSSHQSGLHDYGYPLWGLMILSMFLNRN